jgi:hypothetical protein
MEATFISSNSFSVLGDKTEEFVENRRLKIDCGVDGTKYVKVVSSTFSSFTTVVVDESVLTSNIIGVLYGVVKPGDIGNLPDHFHTNTEGDGGYIEPPPLDFISLTDTPLTYSGTEGYFAKSTGSGIELSEFDKSFLDLIDTTNEYPVSPSNYITITIDHTKIDEDLTDFPVMINIVSGTCTIFDELGENNLKFKVETEGGTQCYTEIENWDSTSKKANLWTKVPLVSSSSDTVLTLTYDSAFDDNVYYVGETGSTAAQKVWDSNFVMVYHMGSDIVDSTVNDNGGTNYGSTLVDGLSGNARSFDGINDKIITSLKPNFSSVTITALFNTSVAPLASYPSAILSNYNTNDGNHLGFRIYDSNYPMFFVDDDTTADWSFYGSFDIVTGQYEALTGVWVANSYLSFYTNNNSPDTDSNNTGTITSNEPFTIGLNNAEGAYFNGIIDEIHISNIARSGSWVKATNYNIKNELTSISFQPNNTKQIILTISSGSIDEDLIDFPAMINLSNSSGLNSFDATEVFNILGENKLKIKVEQGNTQCYVEIESWDSTSNKANLWVKIPVVSSSSDTILVLTANPYMDDNTEYVGETTSDAAKNVWDDAFVGVWHMAQDPSGGINCILDSTRNGNHGTPSGGMVSGDLIDADYGKAINFDGSDDYIEKLSILNKPSSKGSIEVLFKPYGGFNGLVDEILIEISNTDTTPQRCILYLNDDNSARWLTDSSLCYTTGPFSEKYYYLTGIWNEFLTEGFFDGSSIGVSDSFYLPIVSDDIRFGCEHTDTQKKFFDGDIAESRLSKTVRSASWIKTTNSSFTDSLFIISNKSDISDNYLYYNEKTGLIEFKEFPTIPDFVPTNFLDLLDTPESYSGTEGYVVSSTGSGVEFVSNEKSFLDLTDTPITYSGTSGLVASSNGNGIEFVSNEKSFLDLIDTPINYDDSINKVVISTGSGIDWVDKANFYDGIGDPSQSIGNDFDYYYNQETGELYKKKGPVIGTDTLTGGTVSAISEQNGSAYKACDNNSGTQWYATHNTGWWKYDFGAGNEKQINGFSINSYSTKTYSYLTIYGSNDNSTWTQLYTISSVSVTGGVVYSYSFTLSDPYRYVRINMGSSSTLVINEFEVYSDASREWQVISLPRTIPNLIDTPENYMESTGKVLVSVGNSVEWQSIPKLYDGNGEPNLLVGSDFDYYYNKTTGELYKRNELKNDIDVLTGGTVSAISEQNGSAYKACDNNSGTQWYATHNTGWWKYDFGAGNEKQINGFSINSYNTKTYSYLTIYGSNDNSTWTQLYTESSVSVTGGVVYSYSFTLSDPYRYVRINMGSSSTLVINEFEVYSPIYDWQVISLPRTFTNLGDTPNSYDGSIDKILVSNGSGLVWKNEVTFNQLHDGDGFPEISIGSEFDYYYDRIDRNLYVKSGDIIGTDVLTGGTPSASSAQNSPANACDNNSGTFWASSGTSVWWKYDFGDGNEKQINGFSINSYHSYNYTMTIYGSNDNSSWVQLHYVPTTSLTAGTVYKYSFIPISVSYRYVRINLSATGTIFINEFEVYADATREWELLSNPPSFTGLSDTPATYSGTEGYFVRSTGTELNLIPPNFYVLNTPPSYATEARIGDLAVDVTNDRIIEKNRFVLKYYTAKSVIIDAATFWGGDSPGVRSIEFMLGDELIELEAEDIACYATTVYSTSCCHPSHSFITSKSKLGASGWRYNYTEWQGSSYGGTIAPQRLICVFNEEKSFNSIIINNSHSSGGDTGDGIKDIKIYISSDSITNTTYNSSISNSKLIFDGQIDEHVPLNVVDDQILDLSTWFNNETDPESGWDEVLTTHKSFLDLTDTPTTYSGTEGLYAKSTGSGIEWSELTISGGGTSDVQTFLDLTDTPSTYSGTEGYFAKSTGSGIGFFPTSEWLHGESAPSGTIGLPNDFYLNTLNDSISFKTSSWVTNYYYVLVDLASATPIDDFQVKVELTPTNFDYSHVDVSGNDLFFKSLDGAITLDYWIENWNYDGDSIIWVKVASAGDTQVRLYFGNVAENHTESDGNTTFKLFDDFSTSTIDFDKWNTSDAPENFDIVGGNLRVTNSSTYPYMTSVSTSFNAYTGLVISVKISNITGNHSLMNQLALGNGANGCDWYGDGDYDRRIKFNGSASWRNGDGRGFTTQDGVYTLYMNSTSIITKVNRPDGVSYEDTFLGTTSNDNRSLSLFGPYNASYDVEYIIVREFSDGDIIGTPDMSSIFDEGHFEYPWRSLSTGKNNFIELNDTPLTYSGTEGLYAKSTGSGIEWSELIISGGGTSDVQTFLDLTDTPSTYSGTEGYFAKSTGSGIYLSNSPIYTLENTPDYLTEANLGDLAIDISRSSIIEKNRIIPSSAIPSHESKSIIIDIADHWGDFTAMGLRSVDFYDEVGVKINTISVGFSAYATTQYSSTYQVRYAFDTSKSKTGTQDGTEWRGENYKRTNQRLICVFNSTQYISSIVVNNSHTEGENTDRGIKNVKIYTSTDAITETVYNAEISNSTLIFDGVINQHIESDVIDEQILELLNLPSFDIESGWDTVLSVTKNFIDLTDAPSTYSGTENQYAISTGSGIEFQDLPEFSTTFLDLTDTPATYSGTDGLYAKSTGSGISWSEIKNNFIDLDDTPATYSGISNRYLRTTASGIEAFDGIIVTSSGGYDWLIKVTDNGILYTEEL